MAQKYPEYRQDRVGIEFNKALPADADSVEVVLQYEGKTLASSHHVLA